jgi:hypothetical protein
MFTRDTLGFRWPDFVTRQNDPCGMEADFGGCSASAFLASDLASDDKADRQKKRDDGIEI